MGLGLGFFCLSDSDIVKAEKLTLLLLISREKGNLLKGRS